MLTLSVNLFLVFSCLGLIEGLGLPDYIQPCSRSDPKINECVVKNGNLALERIIQGDKRRKIERLVPLKIPALSIQPSETLKVDFKKLVIRGIENLKIEKAEVDLEKMKISAELRTSFIESIGNYEVNGRVLLVPIEGKGKANVSFVDTTIHYTVYFTKVVKRGIEQYAIKKQSMKYSSKRVYYDFPNLFNGDKTLGPQFRTFLNENWHVVDQIFSEATIELLLLLSGRVISQAIRGVPITEVFID